MADDLIGIGIEIEDSGVSALLNNFSNIEQNAEFRQALLDAAVVLERSVKNELDSMVYNRPETRYRRKKGAGMYGATQATGKIDKVAGGLRTGVRTSKSYAPFVMLGTGIFAKDGKGRKTPWIYQDEDGNFHKTVGQRPKPYMTEGAKKAQATIMEVMSGFL